ncbi:DNA-3-methyladenine glycosylase family protein [Pseudomonas fontis]|uniref:DNA-3-methyladenine glycosylase family protein n=1 Tax=Pseudomonas fontis TaxID=2942633 RepID=UPI003B676EA3
MFPAPHQRSLQQGRLVIWLAYRPPYHWPALLAFLQARAITGIEVVADNVYSRTFAIGGKRGTLGVSPARGNRLQVTFSDIPPNLLPLLTLRVRRVFDLDADLQHIEQTLSRDPLMADLIARHPGLRVPGGWDAFEQAMRTVLGQQISVAGAITLASRMVSRHGQPFDSGHPGLTHLFPVAQAVANEDLSTLGMPRSRANTLTGMAQALAINPRLLAQAKGLENRVAALCSLRGIGPWSAQYLALRYLREADAFPLGDVALVKALRLLEGPETPLAERAKAWSPWRAYAAQHLWTSLSWTGATSPR